MNIVVTGANGFIGKNLCTMLAEQGYTDLIKVDIETSRDELAGYLQSADFVYHLAGINGQKMTLSFKKVMRI
ncbi:NAD-dependent epimerase/dehydratase family protein [Psychromonas sp. MME1]|uniref:NAD-dependent epimerase/dehydratase family protein n=1 Tax=Psychromonas sp. MME1 TaxID=3231032 RepID=UPI0034E1B3DB